MLTFITNGCLTDWAKKSEDIARLSALTKLAATQLEIAINHEQLDSDPWLLNCNNGTIDLRTGSLRPHSQSDLITKSTGIEYPTEAGLDTPVWDDFLNSIFLGNHKVVHFLQRVVGYSAAGVIQEHILPILWGDGSNGKSTLINSILGSLGDYGLQAPHGLLMVKYGDSHPTELTNLFGARFVAAAETEEGQQLDEGLVKMLTGGERITARRMREDFWDFEPTHTPFLATNYKPAIRGRDYGIWRRLKLIPFNAKFVDASEVGSDPDAAIKDKSLPDKLKNESYGILRWIVEGCLAWQRDGLNPPDEVLMATKEYREESNSLQTWVDECCESDSGNKQVFWQASLAYRNYKDWCFLVGEKRVLTLPASIFTTYPDGFSFDTKNWVLTFGEHLFLIGAGSLSGLGPAEVQFECSFFAGATGIYHRRSTITETSSPQSTTPMLLIQRPDIQARVIYRFDSTNQQTTVTDNLATVDASLNYWKDAALKEYGLQPGSTGTYPGLVSASPDGLTQQITWSGGGGRETTTTISQAQRHNRFVQPIEEYRNRLRAKKIDLQLDAFNKLRALSDV